MGDHSMNKISIFIRKITIPPVFAVVLLSSMYFIQPKGIGSPWQLLSGILFLAILPILAYPLQKYIHPFKDKGRDGQRTLAMLFSFAGYLLGTVATFTSAAPIELKSIFIEYLFCGISMLLLNKLFKLKASGHACGIIGPIILMVYFGLYIPAGVCSVFVIPVYISSLRTKQHTPMQLLGGALIPAVMLVLVHLFMR